MADEQKPEEPRVTTLGEVAQQTEPSTALLQQPMTMADAYRHSLEKSYPNLKLTAQGAKNVSAFIRNLRAGGSAGVLLICAGDACEYKNACPLYKDEAAPVGQVCPLEAMVVMDTRALLARIVDLETENPVIQGYINELTQVAVLTWRCQMKLAYDYHDVIQLEPAAVGPDGVVHTKPAASPLLEALDRLSTRRSRLLKELALTEEAKWRKEAALGDSKKDSLSRAQSAKKAAIQAQQGILPIAIDPPAHVALPGRTIPAVPVNNEDPVENE